MPDVPRKRHTARVAVLAFALAIAILVVVPLWWPVPPLEGTVPPASLADSDSRFIEVDGLTVHYKVWSPSSQHAAEGADTAFVLLHGFGASTFSWHEVAGPLSQHLPVVAFDRPGFGLTDRPLAWAGPDPYALDAQADLTVHLMDALGIRRAVLVGHSAGGTVAALVAARYPDRVAAVVFEDPAVFSGGPPAFLGPLLRTPQMRRLGPLFVRRLAGPAGARLLRVAWHDPTRIATATIEGYREPLRANDWDKALWLLTIAPRPSDLPGVFRDVTAPVLFITGDDDRIVPPEDTERAAALVDGAQLTTITECGHVPHEERPTAFLDALRAFLGTSLSPSD